MKIDNITPPSPNMKIAGIIPASCPVYILNFKYKSKDKDPFYPIDKVILGAIKDNPDVDLSYLAWLVGFEREIVDSSKLEPVEDFLCLHTWSYYGFFKPSIAEVLSQAPIDTIRYADVFEIIEQPETRADIFRYPEVIKNDFHLSKVRSYKLHE